MKIVAEPENDQVESTLCNVVRMAEIVKDLLVALAERIDAKDVPEAFMSDVECAQFAACQMREMAGALKAEYYGEFERRAAKAA